LTTSGIAFADLARIRSNLKTNSKLSGGAITEDFVMLQQHRLNNDDHRNAELLPYSNAKADAADE
jgi:hypothetical protein